MPAGQTRKSARRVEVKEWRALALKLHHECVPMREIAKRVSKALSTVHEGIEAELAAITAPAAEAVAQRREREREDDLARLAIVIRGSIRKAAKGNEAAAHVVVSAIRQRAKLLGLEAPTKTELSGSNGGPIVFDLSRLTDAQIDSLIAGDTSVLPGGDATPPAGAGKSGEGSSAA